LMVNNMIFSFVNFKWRFAFLVLLMGVASTSFAGLFDDEEARKAILDLRQKVETIDQARTQDKQALQDVPKSVQSLHDENMQMKRSLLELQTLIEQLRADLSNKSDSRSRLLRM
jgi:septal ring factor EnvC (AmiA/AmiB activator)